MLLFLFCFCVLDASAQITIGGNVYGGGNRGDLKGTATVVVQSGTIKGDVFGGARMADVEPETFEEQTINGVTLPKDYATHVLIWGGDVKNVYGGNDITGNISGGTNVAAALKLAKRLGPGKTVVTVLPDTAERYYSTPLFGV